MSNISSEISQTLQKLNQLESHTNEQVAKGVATGLGKVFDFIKGIGKKAEPVKVEPKLDPLPPEPAGPWPSVKPLPELENLIDAVRLAAIKGKMYIPSSALKKGLDEGKSVMQIAMELYPEKFAQVQKDPSKLKKFLEFFKSLFAGLEEESKSAKPKDPFHPPEQKKVKTRWKLLALIAIAAALRYCGVPVSDSEAEKEKGMAGEEGMAKPAEEVTKIPADEIPWKYLGINPKAYEGHTLEKTTLFGKPINDDWIVKSPAGRNSGTISDPAIKEKINKLLQMTPEQRKELKARETRSDVELWSEIPSMAPVDKPVAEPEPDIAIQKAKEPKPAASAPVKKKEKKGTQSDW